MIFKTLFSKEMVKLKQMELLSISLKCQVYTPSRAVKGLLQFCERFFNNSLLSLARRANANSLEERPDMPYPEERI